jgi:hypothetical protein
VTVFAFDIARDRIKHIWQYGISRSYGLGRRADARLADDRSDALRQAQGTTTSFVDGHRVPA